MNCLLCGGIELVAPVSLSCGHCFCWPCWWDKVYVPVIISLRRAEYAESSQNLERPTCPVGRCEVFHLSPLYQGTTMTAEETLKFGDRPVQRQEFAPALRRSGRSRRRNPRYPGYGEILNSNTFHIIIFFKSNWSISQFAVSVKSRISGIIGIFAISRSEPITSHQPCTTVTFCCWHFE